MSRETQRGSILANILAILMMLEIAAVAAAAGYLILTQRVTNDQVRLSWSVMQGKVDDATVSDAAKWREHQAQLTEQEKNKVAGADAATKLAATSVEAEAAWLGINQQFQELARREAMLDRRMQEYDQKRKGLEDLRDEIDRKIAAQRAGTGKQSMQQMLSIVRGLKPALVKEIVMDMEDAVAVEVLEGLDARAAAKVVAEFRSAVEVERRNRLLDMIRTGQMASSGSVKPQ